MEGRAALVALFSRMMARMGATGATPMDDNKLTLRCDPGSADPQLVTVVRQQSMMEGGKPVAIRMVGSVVKRDGKWLFNTVGHVQTLAMQDGQPAPQPQPQSQ